MWVDYQKYEWKKNRISKSCVSRFEKVCGYKIRYSLTENKKCMDVKMNINKDNRCDQKLWE